MTLPKCVANPCLAALIEGAGFSSLDRFGEAINARAWQMHGIKLSYDHVRVKRWIGGSACQYPDVVAAVLSDAWGIPIPVGVIWPELRDGEGPVPAHLQAWVAARTLEDLGVFLRSDMLTRREMLASAVSLATGKAFVDPLARWLGVEGTGLIVTTDKGSGRIGMSTVEAIEQATKQFGATDAAVGGGLSREAAIGQLKYAVDLARHTSYSEVVGARLLAAIANLAGVAGWMSFDVNMNGPAQRYFVYGLQAAHEVGDERTKLRAAGILADMAHQMRTMGHPDTGLRLIELALEQLPADRSRFNTVRAMLWNLKAHMLAPMGLGYLAEVHSAINLSFDLYGEAQDDGHSAAVAEYWPYTSEAELAGVAAGSYNDLATADRDLAGAAERYALRALAVRGEGFARSKAFDQIAVARARFRQAEAEQAALDGITAIDMSASVAASKRITSRLSHLMPDSEPYRDQAAVREFRERLDLALAG